MIEQRRLLALATSFATRFIRKYGLLQHKKEAVRPWDDSVSGTLELTYKQQDEEGNSRSLHEMARLLVVIRNMQRQLNAKFNRPGQSLTANVVPEDESKMPVVSADAPVLYTSGQHENVLPSSEADSSNAEAFALVPANASDAQYLSDFQNLENAVLVSERSTFGRRMYPMENPKDMMARWELDNLDLKTVVKDAILSGRLPLAVLRLHLHRLSNLSPGTENHDTFNDVRVAGRSIAYDLFLKGEIGLAVTTLQKLGEDVETTLKQTVFGTVRRSLRARVAEEMKRYAYLGPHELRKLEMLSLTENVSAKRGYILAIVSSAH